MRRSPALPPPSRLDVAMDSPDRISARSRDHRLITRCPLCGAWTMAGRCGTPHRLNAREGSTNG